MADAFDDAGDEWLSGRTSGGSFGRGSDQAKKKREPLGASLWLPPSYIPPRQWLYGNVLLRRFVSLLVASGGVGKTALTMSMGTSMLIGRGLIGQHVFLPLNVLMLNLEDPAEEFDRRMVATLNYHGVSTADFQGKLFVEHGRKRRLVFAQSTGSYDDAVWFPDKKLLTEFVCDNGIDVVFVDPFINSVEIQENDNGQMNAAGRAWAELADAGNAGVLLSHHMRKGGVAGQIDDGRGGGALKDAIRAGFTLTPMTEQEADGFGIASKERRFYVRLDEGKQNLAPPADAATWFRLNSVDLQNGDEVYPNGDHVQAISKWRPTSPLAALDPKRINEILDELEAGLDGEPYAPTMRGGRSPRWAGNVVKKFCEHTDKQAQQVIDQWLRTGLLLITTFKNTERKEKKGVSVDDTKRP
jgi:hypothetical protein